MNDIVKTFGVAALSATAVALTGWGTIQAEMDSLNEQQIENHEVNNSFYTVRADVVAMKADNLNIHRDIVRLSDRVRATEIASAETIQVLSAVTDALNKQTAATTKLTEQVIRLEIIAASKEK